MLENASLMARFASLVYLPEEELKIKLSQMGYDKFHWIDIEDTQVMIIPPYQDNQLVICFRGTEPDQLTDVLADLKAWRKPSKEKGLVHYGFVEALDKVFNLLAECEQGRPIEQLLEGPVCYKDFRRLS